MNVLWACGGSLGHIVPAFSVIKNTNWNNYLICSNRENELRYISSNKSYLKDFMSLNVNGLNRKHLLINKDNIKNLKLIRRAKIDIRTYLEKHNIEVVVGMGGYVSYLVVSEAIKLNIKTIIHEQNAIYGLSNRLVKNKVDKVLTQFDIDKKAKCIGSPRLTEVRNMTFRKERCDKFRILVFGGSSGSKKINDEFIKLSSWFNSINIEVVLITGSRYFNENKDMVLKSQNKNFKIIPFSSDILSIMNDSSLVISRSGATTIAEILGLKKPSILIPSINVTNNHQEKNARKMSGKNLAILIEESLLNSSYIKKTINGYINNKKGLSKIKEHIEKYTTTDIISIFKNEVTSLINGK